MYKIEESELTDLDNVEEIAQSHLDKEQAALLVSNTLEKIEYAQTDKEKSDIAIEALMGLVGQNNIISLEQFNSKLDKNLTISQEGFVDIIKTIYDKLEKTFTRINSKIDSKIETLIDDSKYTVDDGLIESIRFNSNFYKDSELINLTNKTFKILEQFSLNDFSNNDYLLEDSKQNEKNVLDFISKNHDVINKINSKTYSGKELKDILLELKNKINDKNNVYNKLIFSNKNLIEDYFIAGSKFGFKIVLTYSIIIAMLMIVFTGGVSMAIAQFVKLVFKFNTIRVVGVFAIVGSGFGVVKSLTQKDYKTPYKVLDQITTLIRTKQKQDLKSISTLINSI